MNFEDKVLALFDNGRRSAVYVAGYQSARAQAAAIAAEADRLIAEMAVENAELRESLKSREAELERVRALPSKWREDGEKEEGDGEMGADMACWCCANELEAALASPASSPVECQQCAVKDAELERVHGILKAAQSRSDWGCSACEMYQGVADALASPAAEQAEHGGLTHD